MMVPTPSAAVVAASAVSGGVLVARAERPEAAMMRVDAKPLIVVAAA